MNTPEHRIRKRKKELEGELQETVEDAKELARNLGLDPHPVKYWIVDQEEMFQLVAYGGFQTRFPHWRWGEKYVQHELKGRLGLGEVLELVNNDNPCHAFLQQHNSLADQKAVITHVEAHADLFKNNQWFPDDPNAVEMISKHADRIEEIIDQPDIDREEVEAFIDTVLCIEDNIDQHGGLKPPEELGEERETADEKVEKLKEQVEAIDVSDRLIEDAFDDEWLEQQVEDDPIEEGADDLLGYFIKSGMQYDDKAKKAIELEDWQKEIIEMLRRESYYFAPQKMTKVLNEGWASYWESVMMVDEGFANEDEVIEFADSQARMLANQGQQMNPYKLGYELLRYIENKANRKEVVRQLLKVKGIDWKNFHAKIDFSKVLTLLHHPDHEDPAVRNYSLTRPENSGFIKNISKDDIKELWRLIMERDKYEDIESALEHVDYHAGWNALFDARTRHNDLTLIQAHLDEEFVREHKYFTFEYSTKTDSMRISSKEMEEIRKKMLLQFTNFGKPRMYVKDGNYKNRNELLIAHDYNGIMLDIEEAKQVMERIFDHLWGRPVNLMTINKFGDDPTGLIIRYDGEEFEEEKVDIEEVEEIWENRTDYDTTPDDF